MMNNENLVHAQQCECLVWKPILAGSLVAIGLTFLLNLFSIAIGLTVFTTSSEGVQILAFGGLLGMGIGITASMFASGWLAGYLGQRHCNKRHLGALYGFLTWCVALILVIFLTSHFQQYISFYAGFLSGSAEMVQASSASSISNASGVIISSYIIFSLFFLGAFACSLGGHCGMRHVCNHNVCC